MGNSKLFTAKNCGLQSLSRIGSRRHLDQLEPGPFGTAPHSGVAWGEFKFIPHRPLPFPEGCSDPVPPPLSPPPLQTLSGYASGSTTLLQKNHESLLGVAVISLSLAPLSLADCDCSPQVLSCPSWLVLASPTSRASSPAWSPATPMLPGNQCFISGTGSGFRDLLDPDPGSEKRFKMLHHNKIIFI